MKQFNGNKKVKIEVENHDLSGANGYFLYQVKDNKSNLIKSRIFEDDLSEILSEKQFKQFENGEYKFTVSAQSIFDRLQIFV